MASSVSSASLTSAASVGAGSTVDFTTAKSNIAMVVAVDGTVTGGVIAFEVSHDGVGWAKFIAISMNAGSNQAVGLDVGAYRYVRARIVSAITGGGSVTATFMEAG